MGDRRRRRSLWAEIPMGDRQPPPNPTAPFPVAQWAAIPRVRSPAAAKPYATIPRVRSPQHPGIHSAAAATNGTVPRQTAHYPAHILTDGC